MKPTTLKEALAKKLSQKELSFLTTSYDIIGDIIILEIPPKLVKKEKIIGSTLLAMHPNVLTVCKRAGIHRGRFRTQKVRVIAGKKTKETTYKENNVSLTLDIEQVYFSPRSGTERKRISSLVKPNESVLVMFSGCAPFVSVIAKNTQAKEVFGIELNPAAHYYGQLNARQNRLHNTSLILGDVRKVIPDFYKYIIGLKSSIDKEELQKRLKKKPGIIELHLFDKDLFTPSRYKKIEKTIENLHKQGIAVIIHQPFGYKDGSGYNLGKKTLDKEWDMIKRLGKLCKRYHAKAVVHPSTKGEIANEKYLIENLKKMERYLPYFYFENVLRPPFQTVDKIIKVGKAAGIKNMTLDLAHYMITYKSTAKLVKAIQKIQRHFDTYFHISDSDGKDQALVIGKGKIDFKKVLPYINKGIIEVRSKDENHPREMISSFNKITKLTKTFDRIAMPLPKGAEAFLDVALQASKKGTIIHFYDFLHEDDFRLAEKKIKAACKKAKKRCKILKLC